MIRTPLYSTAPTARAARGVAREADASQEEPAREPERDGYLTKVLKYVPVEFVGPFSALVALTTNVSNDPQTKESFVRALFVVGLLVTPLIFFAQARKLVSEDQPRPFFYVLALLAFAVWAFAVSDQVRDSFGISDGLSEFLLAVGAFGIPGADWLLTSLTSPVSQPVPTTNGDVNG